MKANVARHPACVNVVRQIVPIKRWAGGPVEAYSVDEALDQGYHL